jgi:uncharacterized protein
MAARIARRALLSLPAFAGWLLLSGHAPYRRWDAHRKQRLVIVINGADPTAVRLGESVVRRLSLHLPASRAMLATVRSVLDVVRLLRSGQLEVAVLAAHDALGASEGLPEYGGSKVELTALAALEPSVFHLIVRKESDVSSVRDLAGRKIGICPPSGTADALVRRVLAGIGMEREVGLMPVPAQSAAAALRERWVDALAVLDTVPSGVVLELARTPSPGIRLLDQGSALTGIDAAPAPAVYQRSILPAGTYEGLTVAVPVAAVPHLLVALAHLSNDVAHDIAWALEAAPVAGLPLSVHPGVRGVEADVATQPERAPSHGTR